jgi:hypothetical protein
MLYLAAPSFHLPGDVDLSRPDLLAGPPFFAPGAPFENAKSLGLNQSGLHALQDWNATHVDIVLSKNVVPVVSFIALSASSFFEYSINA